MATERRMSKQLESKLIDCVVGFMVGSGVSEKAITTAIVKSRRSVKTLSSRRSTQAADGKYSPHGDISADLLRLWHRDGRYINASDAKPRALLLSTGRNSIKSLIRRLSPSADAANVIAFMKSARLIKRTTNGRYLPNTADASAITRLDPFVSEHLARSVIRLFSTVRRNTLEAPAPQSLIERYAYVSDLKLSDRTAFAAFSKSQGLAYLHAIDDWMEQRRCANLRQSIKTTERGVVAGVQVVAYLGDQEPDLEQFHTEHRSARGTEGSDGGGLNRKNRPPPRKKPTSLPSASA
jgi:hypothetical protein